MQTSTQRVFGHTFKTFVCLTTLLTSSALSISAYARITPQVIYGADGRYDICDERNYARRDLADSTVAFFESKDLKLTSGGRYAVGGESYQNAYNLCPNEPFADQNVAAFCSGALVAPDLVLTAGHCMIGATACADTKIAFDYNVRAHGDKPDSLPLTSVFSCKEIVALSSEESGGADFALVRLDRPAQNRRSLAFRQNGTPAVGDELFTIGHPSGLPAKIAIGAKVRTVAPHLLVANLDTFAGNSGSPVFNGRTFKIEGVLVSGEEDFENDGACYISKKCSDDACRGEDITPMSEIIATLQKAARASAKKPR